MSMRWLALCAVVVVGCAGTDPPPPSVGDSPPPSVGVYDDLPLDYGSIIQSESDCNSLQDIFNIAENAADGRRDVGDVGGAQDFTRVMVAADHRMTEIGCYD